MTIKLPSYFILTSVDVLEAERTCDFLQLPVCVYVCVVPVPTIICFEGHNLVLPKKCAIIFHISHLLFALIFLKAGFSTHTHLHIHPRTCTHTQPQLQSSRLWYGFGRSSHCWIKNSPEDMARLKAEGRALVSLGKCEVLLLHSTRGT